MRPVAVAAIAAVARPAAVLAAVCTRYRLPFRRVDAFWFGLSWDFVGGDRIAASFAVVGG